MDRSTQPDLDCQEIEALIPAFSVGALDPDEEAEVRAGLARCPQAAAELAQYTELAQALLFSAPPAQPPAYLADRLRAAVADTDVPTDVPDSIPEGSVPTDRGSAGSSSTSSNLWTRLSRLWGPQPRRFSLVMAAIAAILLVVTNIYWSHRVSHLQATQTQLANQMEQQHIALSLMWSKGSHWAWLPAAQASSQPKAVVVWNPDQKIACLYAEDLPALPAHQAYQVWLIRGEQRTSGGLFTVDTAGEAMLLFEPPKSLDTYDAVGITPEPASGSPGPTAPPVIRGKLAS